MRYAKIVVTEKTGTALNGYNYKGYIENLSWLGKTINTDFTLRQGIFRPKKLFYHDLPNKIIEKGRSIRSPDDCCHTPRIGKGKELDVMELLKQYITRKYKFISIDSKNEVIKFALLSENTSYEISIYEVYPLSYIIQSNKDVPRTITQYACLNCETCLTETAQLYHRLEALIEREKNRRHEMALVEEICKNN